MTPERVRLLLHEVAAGRLTVQEAESHLAWSPVEDLGFARIDHHRTLRHGFPEVVFGEGKTTDQIVRIAQAIAPRGDGLLATRLTAEAGSALVTLA